MKAAAVVVLVTAAVIVGSCRGNNPDYSVAYSVAVGGNPDRGRQVIEQRNCGSCHTIPGVRRARGMVAPPLYWFSRRTFIAGELPNTPANLALWVRAPQSVEPRTAMPTLGLSERESVDVAAYLYSLR